MDGFKAGSNELLNKVFDKTLSASPNKSENDAQEDSHSPIHKGDESNAIRKDNGLNLGCIEKSSSAVQDRVQFDGKQVLCNDAQSICRFPQTPSELITWFNYVDRSKLPKLSSSGSTLESDNKFISFTHIDEQDC